MANFPTISEEVKYWFIRAGNNGGKYFHHFRDNNVVALGHADGVSFSFEDGHFLNEADQERVIGSTKIYLSECGESPPQITNKSNQVRRFVSEVKPNDIVITINDTFMMAGTVRSRPYYGTVGLRTETEREGSAKEDCYFSLRCNIDWGMPKRRGLMPVELEKAFRFTGSIMQFVTEDQIKDLNHWLYPIHISEDEVRCTLRISSKDDLSNHQLTKLSSFLDDLELLASYIEQTIESGDSLSYSELEQFIEANQGTFSYDLKAQHLFMSPGHQFIQLPGSFLRRTIYASLLIALLSRDANALEQLPDNVKPMLSSSQGVELVQLYKDSKQIDQLQNSLKVGLSKPSLEDVGGDDIDDLDEGWGTVDSDNSAL